MLRLFVSCLLLAVACGTSSTYAGAVLAFPEADGYGKYTVGGRGGQVYVVTSLEDNANKPQPGTLRYAVEQEGPRIITFAVSGVIHLQDKLVVRNDFITIAGQTSPKGIALRGEPFIVQASQVIVRYMRFRLGATEKNEDAATGKKERDIIFDHCSFSWSIDEVASFYNNINFTLQYSIIAQSLNQASHVKGNHGYGGIWGGAGASFHHNVIAHNTSRNPRIAGHRLKAPYARHFELTDIINNVVYNWGDNSAYGSEDGRFNFIANNYIAGPATSAKRIFQFYKNSDGEQFGQGYFTANQLIDSNGKSIAPRTEIKGYKKAPKNLTDAIYLAAPVGADQAHFFAANSAYANIHTAQDSYKLLIEKQEVGANRTASQPNVNALDSVDTGILNDIAHRTAKFGNKGIINSELEVIESWDAYANEFSHQAAAQQHLIDADLDGMPDKWEADNNVTTPNGFDLSAHYTNLEVYINQLGQF